MSSRAAFTLSEILVALMIFSFVSLAMVGSLLVGTRLFRDGEMRRGANDEAMAVLAMLERDIERAVPTGQGGEFYAMVPTDPDPYRASCVVGWTVPNPDPFDVTPPVMSTQVVLWGRGRDGVLRRAVIDSLQVIDDEDAAATGLDTADPRIALENLGSPVNRNCLFFGVWLAGTRERNDPLASTLVAPQDQSWWRRIETADGSFSADAEPVGGQPPYTTSSLASVRFIYPSAMRLMLLMEGSGTLGKEGIVYADDGGSGLQVGGLQGVPTTPGSVLVIDNEADPVGVFAGNPSYEIVGHTGQIGQRLQVNANDADGPLGPGGDGRGVYRSFTTTHARGDRVRLCQPFTLVKALPR